MLAEIKKMLLDDPEKIISILELYSFHHICIHGKEIRAGREENSNPTSVCIYLENNDYLNVFDRSLNLRKDLFSYIMEVKHVEFRDVLQTVKAELGLGDDWRPKQQKFLFNGIYASIGKRPEELPIKTYPEEILIQYLPLGNERFLKDHISLRTQKKFGIMYNANTQRIIIPIRNITGDLCGIKARRNYDTDDVCDPKYIFEESCQKNRILYGAFDNYSYLMNADKILIGEAEKFTLACDSYDWHSAVSLMGNALSEEQSKILLSFNAKEYCFMLDEGLDIQVTMNNIKLLKDIGKMKQFKTTWWNYNLSLINGKDAPTDMGKKEFYRILNSDEIEEVK